MLRAYVYYGMYYYVACYRYAFVFALLWYTLCMVITYKQKGKDQPGKVVNPARGQLNREENEYFPVTVVPIYL